MEITALACIDVAKRALMEVKDIQQTLEIRDRAAAMASYAEARGANEMAQIAKEVQIRAERKAGEFLKEMEKHPAGRPMKNRLHDATDLPPTLEELGIERTQSHRWQTIARMPEIYTNTFWKRSCL